MNNNNPKDQTLKEDEDMVEEIIAYDDENGVPKDLIGDNDLFDEDEFEISNCGGENKEDDEFDRIVGCLQDIVIDPAFEILQRQFFEKHYQNFEDAEENKHEYTPVFKDYQTTIENSIEAKLKEMVPNFDIARFMKLLQTRKNQIEDELLDMLLSFTDFQIFKELMISYKRGKNGKIAEEVKANNKENEPQNTIITTPSTTVKEPKQASKKDEKKLETDLGGLSIAGKATVIHKDMDSEGEERPDLQLDIIPIPTPKKIYSKANPKPETGKVGQNKNDNIFNIKK
jgi:ADP-ribosylation factor 2-binding protein